MNRTGGDDGDHEIDTLVTAGNAEKIVTPDIHVLFDHDKDKEGGSDSEGGLDDIKIGFQSNKKLISPDKQDGYPSMSLNADAAK